MSAPEYIQTRNAQTVSVADIPILSYERFYNNVIDDLKDNSMHCLSYFVVDYATRYWFVCCLACDHDQSIRIYSHEAPKSLKALRSISVECTQMHIFEREIHENFGIHFEGHPWLKPVRWPHNRANASNIMDNYPFYTITGSELHEVGVGPIHAGVIEPGHFRFICNGEKVMHLEIHLGYQHRGVEQLYLSSKTALQRALLSESIAGDSAVASAMVHAQLIESLAGIEVPDALQLERCIGLELERIAVHVGDTAALSADVAYQLGQVVNEALRTTFINTTQFWCGNRFGKGLIKPGGTRYPLSDTVMDEIEHIIHDSGNRYFDIAERIYSLPTVLSRFDGIGTVSRSQMLQIGAVGMAARSSGLLRDIRRSHPFQYFTQYPYQPVLLDTGDVLARGLLRYKEAKESVRIIGELLATRKSIAAEIPQPVFDYKLRSSSMVVSLAEAWRGELCHIAITDANGDLIHYKVKDPSLHNWMALALAVRNQEISDFPVCNKSFNLSYCGYDL